MGGLWVAAGLGLALLSGTGCQAQADTRATGAVDGRVVYDNYCFPCHGPDAHGNQSVGAPAIAGLPEWYVETQLQKFRGGVRGAHVDDVGGMKMRPMAVSLASDTQVENVSAYVASLPPQKQPDTLQGGDPSRGAAAYVTCMACHGADASGNKALGAPPLQSADDWYMLQQLHNFKSGVRGANPKDATGATMRPMAMTLADEQAMKDIIAHIRSLQK
jgi:cytochrome c553